MVVHPWYGLTGGRVAVVSAGSSAGEATWRGQALVPLVGGGPALVLRLGLDRPQVLHNLGGWLRLLGKNL